jgi:hypothetical protein
VKTSDSLWLMGTLVSDLPVVCVLIIDGSHPKLDRKGSSPERKSSGQGLFDWPLSPLAELRA